VDTPRVKTRPAPRGASPEKLSFPRPVNPTATALPFRNALMAMLGIGLVNMLVALDQTVVSTALPSIVAELHGFEYYAWIASAYLLASVVTVPVFGRLGDYFGRKRFVIAARLSASSWRRVALGSIADALPYLEPPATLGITRMPRACAAHSRP